MGLVVVTEPTAGSTTNVADVNNTLSSWNTNSTGIGAVNVRDEGLDRRSIAAGAVTPSDGRSFASLAGSVAIATTTPTYTEVLAQTLDVDASAAGDMVRVRCSFVYDITGATVSPGETLLVRLEVSTNGGGAWAAVARTDREFGVQRTGDLEKGSHCIIHKGTSSAATVRYRLVAARSAAGPTFTVSKVSLLTRVLAK